MGRKFAVFLCQSNNYYYLCIDNQNPTDMTIVSTRDFRANQSKFLGMALRGEDVILRSRQGSVRLTPVEADISG